MSKQILILFSLTALFVYGCSDNKAAENKAAAPAPAGYTLAKAEHESVQQVMKLPAQLAAYQEVSIFPKVNGYVKTVLVDIGSHVQTGQLLMMLEAPELDQATAIRHILHHRDTFLLPTMTVKEAIAACEIGRAHV